MEQRLEAGKWPRHRHWTPYAAIVLSGGYLEAGGDGRFRVEAGDVVVHPAFDAHQNQLNGPAWVLNLPLDLLVDLPPVFRVDDLDTLERAWREDIRAAPALLRPSQVKPALVEDWPDLLAANLKDDPGLGLSEWGRTRKLGAATISRGFAAAFGITPARHRAERRVRLAWRRLMTETGPMADLALDCGYADQAHMCRAVRALTGASPKVWRGKSVQDRLKGAR